MKVILATDGTEYGEAAAAMLGKFALKSGDEVRIISVVDMAMPLGVDIYGGYVPDTSALEQAARSNAEKVVDASAAKLRGVFNDVEITTDVLFGSPDSRIVETAEEIGADMIVIGSHGYKRWERLLLGSVSNSVVHHAHCSVLVVRTIVE